MVANRSLLKAAFCILIALAFVPTKAEATVRSVTVKTTRNYENADGYTYAEISIQGTVARADGSVGQYSVPAVIIYPGTVAGMGSASWIG
jgi:hypothetical protein